MLPRKQKKPNKGFHRSAKEWEESIAGHIGKAIDNGHILDYLLTAGLAVMGYDVYGTPGILIGPLALKLAQAPSIPAAATGVAVLGHMGLTSTGIINHLYEGAGQIGEWITEHLRGFPEWAFGKEPPIIGGEGGKPGLFRPFEGQIFGIRVPEIGEKKK